MIETKFINLPNPFTTTKCYLRMSVVIQRQEALGFEIARVYSRGYICISKKEKEVYKPSYQLYISFYRFGFRVL